MKKIKPIVLKDATKLTTAEMKNICGGWYENSSSSLCSATCATGALKEFVSMDCSKYPYPSTCVISHEGYETIAVCVRDNDGCETGFAEFEDRCGNPLPPLGV